MIYSLRTESYKSSGVYYNELALEPQGDGNHNL